MISERTLKKWRRDALKGTQQNILDTLQRPPTSDEISSYREEIPGELIKVEYRILPDKNSCERILRLTQELLDLYLLKK